MTNQADVVRSIKIKTNTLRRLQKEFKYYLEERDKEQARVERLKAEGADPYDLKQAVRSCRRHCSVTGHREGRGYGGGAETERHAHMGAPARTSRALCASVAACSCRWP